MKESEGDHQKIRSKDKAWPTDSFVCFNFIIFFVKKFCKIKKTNINNYY